MAQGKSTGGEQGRRAEARGAGAAPSPARPASEMDGLFVDAEPALGKGKKGRAADRRRARGDEVQKKDDGAETRRSLNQNARAAERANGAGVARGTVRCTHGPEEGVTLNLLAGSYTVGRARDNSFVLKDIAASRQHVRIDVDDDGARIVDLGSGNGTRVNGKRAREVRLSHGDTIEIGASVLLYEEAGRAKLDASAANGAQDRVMRAAEQLARELSERMRFGEPGAFDDGHVAQTQAIAAESGRNERPERRGSGGAQARLWHESDSNVPLNAVEAASQPLRGGGARPDESERRQRGPSAPPSFTPAPETPPPPLEAEAAPARSPLLIALIVSVIVAFVGGGVALAGYIVFGRTSGKPSADVNELAANYKHAMDRCEDAFRHEEWAQAAEYANAALQIKPGDPLAATYARDATARIVSNAPASALPAAQQQPLVVPVAIADAPAAVAAPAAPVAARAALAVAQPPPPAAAGTGPAAPAAPAVAAPAPQPAAFVRVNTAAPAPKPPPPAPRPVKRNKGITDEEAQALFQDAVDALRQKDTKGSCAMLEKIAAKAPTDSVWKDKAEKLYARKCDG